MFLAFGSLVLPIKAALMSALTLGSTMGILTWMFVDGHGSGLMNYTPQPLMAPMIGLIIAVIWGLSTDYEVFLVSRMVEARARGMSTAEAIRIGTATTGRLITGAALVLAVVAGAFVFSDLVMMKYLAFGLLLALLLDATVVRMFLVPGDHEDARRRLLVGAAWMKRIQERLGLGETELPDERKRPTVREPEDDADALVGAGAPVRPRRCRRTTPRHPGRRGHVTTRRGAPTRVSPPPAAGQPAVGGGHHPACPPTPRRRAAGRTADHAGCRPPSADATPRATRSTRATTAARGRASGADAARRADARRTARSSPGWANCAATRPPPTARRGEPREPRAVPPSAPDARATRPPPATGGRPPTTAIPAQRPPGLRCRPRRSTPVSEADENPSVAGGGVSAADLLRREGRL